ncbi:MAG: right-handed parallel beta-helix repeat-containing protein [Thermomicrobium sp.]|nr:right-handed parallel beta-helix repeat-containing protein [Thermomicrobium sp.]
MRWTGGVVALLVGSLALAAAGGALVFVPATGAAEVTITVAGTSDGTGSCSGSGTTRSCATLRAAVMLANSLTDPVTIQLQDGSYQLSIPPATDDTAASGDLDVTKRGGALRIVGRGQSATTIVGAWPAEDQADRLFDVGAGATLILEKLTLSGGRAIHDDARDHDGGAIWVGGALQLADVTFEDNFALSDGGALFVGPSGTVSSLEGASVTFRQNTAGDSASQEDGNGGALAVAGTVVLDSTVIFAGNSATGTGGAVWVAGGRLVLGSRVTLGGNAASDANRARDGGALAVHGGQVELRGTLVRGNQAGNGALTDQSGRGGGIWVVRGQVTLRQVKVLANQAVRGGGIASNEGILTLLDSEVRENQARLDGGGNAVLGKGTVQIVGGTIAANTAEQGDGGGILNAGTLALSRTVIEANRAEAGAGGGVSSSGTLDLSSPEMVIVRDNRARLGGGLASTGTSRLRSLVVQKNAATQDGGGIWNQGDMVLDAATIEANRADAAGGGIYHTGSKTLTLQGNTIVRGNQAALDGGGIAALGKASLNGATVVGNVAGGSGGGLAARGQVDLQRVQAIDNQATNDGGGLLVEGAAKVTVADTAIRRSSAGQLGGGIAVRSGGQFTMIASSVTENQTTSYGGGIAVLGTVALTNVTVSTNVSQQRGGGLWVGPRGTASLQFVTLAANAAAAGGALYNDGGEVTLRGTLLAASPGGGNCGGLAPSSQGGNLEDRDSCGLRGTGDLVNANPNLQPLQVDPSGGTLYHALGLGSTAIDAAGTQGCPSEDQLHTKRPQGPACDIGAWELPVPEATPLPTASPTGPPGVGARPTTTPTARPVFGPATPITGPGPTPTPTIGLPATGSASASPLARTVGVGLLALGVAGMMAGGVGMMRGRRSNGARER